VTIGLVDVALVMLGEDEEVEAVSVSMDVVFVLVEVMPVLKGMLDVVELLTPVESELVNPVESELLIVPVELDSSEQDLLVLEEESEEYLVPCSPLRRSLGT
jgi:hypothetical protein